MNSKVTAAGIVFVTLACACARPPAATVPRSSSRVLAGSELQHPAAANAFDLIRVRRPAFFSRSGPAGEDLPVVYIDDVPVLALDELRQVPTYALVEIRYLTASEATFRYGFGHSGGAIVVRTDRNRIENPE